MKFCYWRVAVLSVALTLLLPIAANAAEQTIEVQVLPAGTLAINVQQEIHILAVAGEFTGDFEYYMNITNTTSEGWDVTLAGTDFTSYDWECDEWGTNCIRVPTDPLYTIDVISLLATGGDADQWGDPGAVTVYGSNIWTAGTPIPLLSGTGVAYGSFDIDGPRPRLSFETPGTVVPGNYYATLTYTIMAQAP